MRIVYSLNELQIHQAPTVLSIGNFDGVHLGHQAVLKRLLETAHTLHFQSAVLTFSNHPSTVLRPTHPTPFLCTVAHKMRLLESMGIDLALLIPFTQEFSEQSAEAFLQNIRKVLPFNILILGHDAHIGKNREGDRHTVTNLGRTLGFQVEYIPDCFQGGHRISSSLIRDHIQKGQLVEATSLLGRPYSIAGRVMKGRGRGVSLGFPTANLTVSDLCLPPFGVYAVRAVIDGQEQAGIANLGVAPTIRQDSEPLLEVHFFADQGDLYNREIDVQLRDFIRTEKVFQSIEELKQQIAVDIVKAKSIK